MKRLDTTEWDNHYNNWRASKMSISAYCKSTGINYQRLCYWRQVKEGSKKRPVKNKFIKLPSMPRIAEPQHKALSELVFTNGARLLCYEAPDANYLKQLMS